MKEKDLEKIIESYPIGAVMGITFGGALYAFTKEIVFITSIPCYTLIFSTTIGAIEYLINKKQNKTK